jgi:predicted 3-demethylubiquinone-9 3-methyltransferase (glyoxalase superfamily)
MAPTKKTTKVKVQGVTPFLWYEKDCVEAAKFYVSLVQGSRMVATSQWGCEFELAGQRFMALNGGPDHPHTDAFSIYVSVQTQAQVDTLWDALTKNGGRQVQCGWLVDKYGVSWQIIPERLMELLWSKDPQVAQASMQAMMKMKRIEIAKLDAAVAAVKAKGRGKVVA